MNIGFDFDGIFINTPPFVPKQIIELLYREKSNGALAYRMPSPFEQKIRQISHMSLLRPAIKHNIEFIQNRKDKSNNYYLISSRFGFLKNPTNNLVRKHQFEKTFKDIFFNFDNKQPHIFKHHMIQKLQIHRFVDDDLQLLLFLAEKNQKSFFYWLNQKHSKKLEKNLFAITHLSELFR